MSLFTWILRRVSRSPVISVCLAVSMITTWKWCLQLNELVSAVFTDSLLIFFFFHLLIESAFSLTVKDGNLTVAASFNMKRLQSSNHHFLGSRSEINFHQFKGCKDFTSYQILFSPRVKLNTVFFHFILHLHFVNIVGDTFLYFISPTLVYFRNATWPIMYILNMYWSSSTMSVYLSLVASELFQTPFVSSNNRKMCSNGARILANVSGKMFSSISSLSGKKSIERTDLDILLEPFNLLVMQMSTVLYLYLYLPYDHHTLDVLINETFHWDVSQRSFQHDLYDYSRRL